MGRCTNSARDQWLPDWVVALGGGSIGEESGYQYKSTADKQEFILIKRANKQETVDQIPRLTSLGEKGAPGDAAPASSEGGSPRCVR